MLLELFFTAVIGILAGGVVNILADDLPLRRSVRLPRYVSEDKKRAIHLPSDEIQPDVTLQDDEKRPLIAWLGITAFLFGKRRSPSGNTFLNWRYPLAELLTAALMVLTVYAARTNDTIGDIGTLQLIFWLIYMVLFSLIVIIDIEHKLILFVVIIPFALLALLDAFLTKSALEGFTLPHLSDALRGGGLGFLVFFIMYYGGFLFTYVIGTLRGQEIDEVAFGYGDVMLATVSGLLLGWQVLIFAMFITVFLGALGALLYLLSRRFMGMQYSAFTALPYGPYIVAGTILMMLYRVPISEFLMGK